jgi:uncharacterized protein YjbI with pentapeptide repeats
MVTPRFQSWLTSLAVWLRETSRPLRTWLFRHVWIPLRRAVRSGRSWPGRRGARLARRPAVPGRLHHRAAPPKSPRDRRWPMGITVLYAVAVATAVYGVVRIVLDFSGASLGYLAGLVGIFMAAGAGIQQIGKQREERRQGRLQAEQESLRRFDERFSAVTHDLAAGTPGERAGAAAALMSFLRDGNTPYHQQTYYYILSQLQSAAPQPTVQHTLVRAFEYASHLVLPALAESTRAVPDAPQSRRHSHGPGGGDRWQPLGERRLALDFGGATLAGADLSLLELSEADLSKTDLSRALLYGSCLWRAHGANTNLASACLRHANLEEAVLPRLHAPEADFTNANLVAARFAARGRNFPRPRDMSGRAVLRDAQFVRARLQGACLNGADLRDARFDGANLKGASFHGALLNEAALRTVLRSVKESWRKARWDPATVHELNRLRYAKRGGRRPASPRRKAADVPARDYRRHPYRQHQDPPRRIPRAA